MRHIISWLCIGGILFALNRPRTPDTIDAQTLSSIESISGVDTQSLWPGYEIVDFPIDVYYSPDLEFRYHDEEIQSQLPTLDSFALTIDIEEEQPILKVTNTEQWSLMTNYGQHNKQEALQHFQALVLHEGFHGFQYLEGYLDYFEERISLMNLSNPEALLLSLDNDEVYRELWLKEQEALNNLYLGGFQEKQTWLEAREAREDYLMEVLEPEQVRSYLEWEALMESVEGGARFIELQVSQGVSSDELHITVDPFYSSGMEKLYQIGALKVAILQKYLGVDWQIDFYQGNHHFTDLLIEV